MHSCNSRFSMLCRDPIYGIFKHKCRDLHSRHVLDDYLSRALNIELENKRLALIDESDYVLTLDYTIKMLNIHERYELLHVRIYTFSCV